MNTRSKKIRVAIVINDFLVGGAQRLIIGQLKYFDTETYDLHLITLFEVPKRKDFYHEIPSDVAVHRVDMKSPRSFLGWLRVARIFFRIRPHVVFSHLFFANTVARVLQIVLRYRLFSVEHNTYMGKKKWEISLDRFLGKRSEKIIAVSTEVKDFTVGQQRLNDEKCVVIPNGIDLLPIEEFKQTIARLDARQKIKIDSTKKLFLSVGRLTPQKNQVLLINSFITYARLNHDAILILAGEGELQTEFQKIIDAAEMQGRILLVGATKDIYYYYRAADFIISTSKIEGMSLAYLEALAFGLPLVTTKTGGTNILLRNGVNGFAISQFEIQSVIHALKQAEESNYETLSKNAFETATQFSVEKNTRTYEDLISRSVF